MSRRSTVGLVVFALVALVLLVVIAFVVVVPSFSTKPLPTALALPPTDTARPPTLVTPSPTSSPTVAATATITASITSTQTQTSTSSATTAIQAAVETATSESTSAAPVEASATTASSQDTPAPTDQQPTVIPSVVSPTDAPTQASQPTQGPGATVVVPTFVAPTITPTYSAEHGVPLQSLVPVSNGAMMVVSAAFPATSTFKDMGVTAPAPPAGTAWALVEALMKCAANVNCSPAPSSLKVLGSSGKSYAATTAFKIDPSFGPDGYSSGQVWGYLEFAVPTSEQTLRLTFTQGNQTYIFALQ